MNIIVKVVALLLLVLSCSTQNVYRSNEGRLKEKLNKFYKYPYEIGSNISRDFKSAANSLGKDQINLSNYVADLKSLLLEYGSEEYLKNTVTPFYNYLDSIEVVDFINLTSKRGVLAFDYLRNNEEDNHKEGIDENSNDSLFLEFLKIHSELKINDDIIYFAGMLDELDILKILQDSLRNKYFNFYAVELALARSGVAPHYNNVLNRNRIYLENESKTPFYSDSLRSEYICKEHDLFYLNSMESILECTKLLRTNLLMKSPTHGAQGNYFLRDFTLGIWSATGDFNIDELMERVDYFYEIDRSEAIEYFEKNYFNLKQPNFHFPRCKP